MKIKTITIAILLILFMGFTTTSTKSDYHNSCPSVGSNWYRLIQEYIPPTIISGLTGMGTAYTLYYIEQKLKLTINKDILIILALWYAEYLGRNSIINTIETDFDNLKIPYKNNIMRISSWLASWITYIKLNHTN